MSQAISPRRARKPGRQARLARRWPSGCAPRNAPGASPFRAGKSVEELHQANMAAWDLASTKYEPEVEQDVAFLQAGGTSLLRHEQRLLCQLSPWCGRAIHLQCSH